MKTTPPRYRTASPHRIPWRRWISNVGLIVGMILVLFPLGMRVYGGWWEDRERTLFLAQAAAGAPIAPDGANDAGQPVTPTTPPKDVPDPKDTPSVEVSAPERPAPKDAQAAQEAESTLKAPEISPEKPSVRKPSPRKPSARKPSSQRASVRSAARNVRTLARPPQPWRKSLLQIPSIGVDAPVSKARGNWKWIKGPAYDPRSAGPGGAGNAVIAAHRNMWARTFADLPRVQPGDRIYVQTKDHRYTYIVDWSRKVGTRNDGVLTRTKDPCITLYTCVLPFRADQRWAVRGRLVDVQAAAPSEPGPEPGSDRLARSR